MTSGPAEGKRGDLELVSIPRAVIRAAESHGDLAAVSDEGVTLSFAALASAVEGAARCALGRGRLARRPKVADLGAQHLGVGGGRPRRFHAARAALVPINTRFSMRGIEAKPR